MDHMEHKYSNSGYIKLWLPNSPNEEYLRLIRNTINNREALRQAFERIFETIQ